MVFLVYQIKNNNDLHLVVCDQPAEEINFGLLWVLLLTKYLSLAAVGWWAADEPYFWHGALAEIMVQKK